MTSPPMAAAVSRNSPTRASDAPGHMVQPIPDGCGHHPRRAIGGRRHDLPTSGVFLVHCHGIGADPVVDDMRRGQVQAALAFQRLSDRFLRGVSHSARRARCHRFPAPRSMQARITAQMRRSPSSSVVGPIMASSLARFICAMLLPEARAISSISAAVAKGWGERCGRGGRFCAQFRFGHDKAAADGIIGFLSDDIALRIGCHQTQAVGMAGQGRAIVEHQVSRRVKTQRAKPVHLDRMLGFYVGQFGLLRGVAS